MPIVTTGLQLSLDASNPSSYSGTGSTWLDLTSNHNNFTLYNSPTWNSLGYFNIYGGVTGGSLPYFGLTSAPANLIQWAAADYTICYWVYNSSFNGNSNGTTFPSGVGNSAPVGGTEYWTFGTDASGTVTLYYYNGGQQIFNTSTVLSLNTWNHLALTQTGGALKIYVNGSLVATTAVSGTPVYDSGTSMSLSGQAGGYIDGAVYTMQIYNIALNSSQITQNYTAATPPTPVALSYINQDAALLLAKSTAPNAAVIQDAALTLLRNPSNNAIVPQDAVLILLKYYVAPNVTVNVIGTSATGVLGNANAFAQGVTIYAFAVAGYGGVKSVSVYTQRNAIIAVTSVIALGEVRYPTIRWNNVITDETPNWGNVPHQRG